MAPTVPVASAPIPQPPAQQFDPRAQLPSIFPTYTGVGAPATVFNSRPPIQSPQSLGMGKRFGILIAIFVFIILGGLVAYGYSQQLGPFARPPYDQKTLASSIFAGMGNIKTASYSLRLNVVSEPRQAGARPFSSTVSSTSDDVSYKMDLDVFRDIQSILSGLQSYYRTNKAYPVALSQLTNVPAAKKSVYRYLGLNGGSNFGLSVTFQTSDAVNSIQKDAKLYSGKSAVAISGRTVTFSKDTPNYMYLPSERPQPFLVSLLGMQQYLGSIPSDFSLDGTISGASQKLPDQTVNSRVQVTANTNLNDINISLDAQFEKIADTYYFMVSKFPSIFFDISKIKEKWIKITPEDMATYGAGYMGNSAQSTQDKLATTKERVAQGLKIVLTVADADQALVLRDDPIVETVNGTRAYRYDLVFNKSNMAKFYTDLTSQFSIAFKENDPLIFDQSTLDYLNSQAFGKVYDYFRDNTALTLWADKNGTPIQAAYALRLVPDDTQKNSDRQVRMTVTLGLSNINQSVQISAPATSINLEDVMMAVTGQSKAQYEFSKQMSTIRSIQSQLSLYKMDTGVYPASLDDLTKTSTGSKYNFTPTMTVVPKDIFTSQPFTYVNKGSDYALSYTVQLSPYEKGTAPTGIYQTSYDYSSANYKQLITMTALDGTNTADSKVVSEEAAKASKVDSDKDGLPDILEKYLGTNLNKKDTDGDGYSDYDELLKGSDPLGPGNLKGGSSMGMF